jgi:peptidyl-prolyl cis-trans isomerase B (cyclophilin B)
VRGPLVNLIVVALFALPVRLGPAYPVGRIRTDLGEILIYLHPQTPNHRASFIRLAREHYWDSLTFNRVVRNFVAQGGCPDTPAGFKGSPYNLAPEFNDSLRHVYGAVGAGRDDNPEKLSAGCQFYIVVNRDGLKRLDGNYTVYGQVIKGMDVVEAIVSVPSDSTDTPLQPIGLHVDVIEMTAAQLAEYGIRPQ